MPSDDIVHCENSQNGSIPPKNKDTSQYEDHKEQSATIPESTQTHKKKKPGCTLGLFFTSSVIIIMSFQYGFQTGVINTPQQVFTECTLDGTENAFFPPCFPIDDTLYGWVASVFTIGGLVGSLCGGWISEKLGRRLFLWCSNIVLLIGLLFQSLLFHVAFLIAGRLIAGIGVGLGAVGVTVYLAEISPDRLRGAVGCLHEFAITIGIFISQLISIPLSQNQLWRVLFGIPVILILIQLIALPFCVQSPRWLLSKNKMEIAKKMLTKLRGRSDVDDEISDILTIIREEESQKRSLKHLFRKELIKPLIIVCAIELIQHATGINVVVFYSTDVLIDAKVPAPDYVTAALALVSVIVTVMSFFLVDKVGRKPLLLLSELIVFICLVGLSISFIFKNDDTAIYMNVLSIISLVVFMAGFSTGVGPIPTLLVAEILPDDVRSYGVSFGEAVNWIAQFIIGVTFYPIQQLIGNFAFVPYSVLVVIAMVFIVFFIPETKKVPLGTSFKKPPKVDKR